MLIFTREIRQATMTEAANACEVLNWFPIPPFWNSCEVLTKITGCLGTLNNVRNGFVIETAESQADGVFDQHAAGKCGVYRKKLLPLGVEPSVSVGAESNNKRLDTSVPGSWLAAASHRTAPSNKRIGAS